MGVRRGWTLWFWVDGDYDGDVGVGSCAGCAVLRSGRWRWSVRLVSFGFGIKLTSLLIAKKENPSCCIPTARNPPPPPPPDPIHQWPDKPVNKSRAITVATVVG